jgi:SAM-dependent methyltransferase
MLPQTSRDSGTVQCTGVTLDRLEQNWQALGEQDPLWAILSVPAKRGGGWDLDEFFASGESDLAEVMVMLENQQIPVARDRALDFGCGVGRLTRALATHFRFCDGVDLASSMIEHAKQLRGIPDGVRFHHNEAIDLRLFESGSFDFLLSLYVLQHMEPELMRGYIAEFVRVLRPNGVAYFNVPDRTVRPEPLAPGAWHASLALGGPLPELRAGGAAAIELEVRNDSPIEWPGSGQVQVGSRWRGPGEEPVAADEGRAPLEDPLAPGETRNVPLVVIAPGEPGPYELVLDLIQEWVGWFAGRGSEALRLKVQVAPGDGAADQEQRRAPTIEMHTLSRREVTATVEAAGGVVLAAVSRERCGPAMPSFDYMVGRTPGDLRPQRRIRASVARWLGR